MTHAWTRPAALLLASAVVASPARAAARDDRLFEGYDALWQTLPHPAFTVRDERPLADPQTVDGQAYRAWAAPRGHRVAWLGDTVTIDRRAFPFARAAVFPGEVAGEPGADARLFVGARDVCVQGTPPTASGTAQRHTHVMLVLDAFTPRARRYDLPSLFGSCLALTHDARPGLGFLAAGYHTPEGSEVSDGIAFERWRLHDGRFATYDAAGVKMLTKAHPETIANKIYGNRLGNGPPSSGDGWKYCGRGLIQVTGKESYQKVATQYQKQYADKVDFVSDPDKMGLFPYDVRSAISFWVMNHLGSVADKGATDAVVDKVIDVVNSKTKTRAERKANFKVANDVLK